MCASRMMSLECCKRQIDTSTVCIVNLGWGVESAFVVVRQLLNLVHRGSCTETVLILFKMDKFTHTIQ